MIIPVRLRVLSRLPTTENKKGPAGRSVQCNSCISQELGLGNGACRASLGTSAAIYAEIGIDVIDIALADSSGRAFAHAGTACNAIF